MSSSQPDIETLLERFRRERPPFAVWDYIEASRTPEQRQKLHEWRGPESLREWIAMMTMEGALPSALTLPEEYRAHSKQLYEHLSIHVDHLSDYDVEDFLFCSVTPRPKVVLDFGAGFGRQAFLFSRLPVTLISMDCIESSYFLQRHVFQTLNFPLWEYLEETGPPSFSRSEFNIVHLPSWKADLIPDRSVDLVLAVFVLSEISSGAAEHFLSNLTRVLRIGGHLYVRDAPHSRGWELEKSFAQAGFKPVFFPWKDSEAEFRGTPRLYRYLPGTINSRSAPFIRSFFLPFLRRWYLPREILVRLKRRVSRFVGQ